ncbi:hypothetical protein [Gramella sp. Hel_I_59]|uniref:hypothetical protein n=1 Tax=Gramella sp. Hel_I_59 TaxID=1249978 RepID=UPI00114DD5F8|nr:hypothetical protein [Gramella sp. Hel_I_59]
MKLATKPMSYQFSEAEKDFIKSQVPIGRFRIIYAIYKPHSSKGKYVCLIVDQMHEAVRKSGAENRYIKICDRPLTASEYDWEIKNYGSYNRRFVGYYFKTIEDLKEMDDYHSAVTPQKFIDECTKRGYFKNRPAQQVLAL